MDSEKAQKKNRPLAKIGRWDKIENMKYEKIAEYSNTKFRRITGGRTPKLSIEDLLLATLEYLREYRTYAHIAASYGIVESNIYRGIKWVEDTLIQDGTFLLPGRKVLLKSDIAPFPV